jgi:hypothetical protein
MGGELLPDRASANPVLRSQTISLEGGYGYGAELRYQLPSSSFAIGISLDYSTSSVTSNIAPNGFQTVPVEDGFRALAAEVTGYFFIPLGGQSFGLFMGGGGGGYWGERFYRVGGVEAPVVGSQPGFGIHVLGGAHYRFTDHVSAMFVMKFRDLQFESTNAFPAPRIVYRNATMNVGTTPFRARIEANSVMFSLGLSVSI